MLFVHAEPPCSGFLGHGNTDQGYSGLLPSRDRSPAPWCIAGGYALELFVGSAFRAHADIDILIFRKHQLALQNHFSGWEMYYGTRPGLAYWEKGLFLEKPYYDIWARKGAAKPWQFQIMLMDTEGEEWIFKRDENIRGLSDNLFLYTDKGIPILHPAIQLLYKSKHIRPKDELDYQKAYHLLDVQSKKWLSDCLNQLYPKGHLWLEE